MAETTTTATQRTIIWIIAIVMTVGTLGSFFIFLLPAANEPVKTQAQLDYEKQVADYKKQEEARIASLQPLDGYAAEAFDAGSVTELKSEDLVVGEGKEVTESSTISANYFGWTADGKIFDSTRKTTNKDGAAEPAEFALTGVIQGWTKGLAGAQEGSVRKLMIPTDMAYGKDAAASGRPAGPLAFIVEIKSVK